MTTQQKIERLMQDERYPDGRSCCRVGAEIRIDCRELAFNVALANAGARPFLMADGRRGYTMRPSRGSTLEVAAFAPVEAHFPEAV